MKDRVALKAIAAKFGTPVYVYDRATLRKQCETLTRRFPGFEIHYAMKANSNPSILREIRTAGLGVEAVSEGELAMARQVGFPRNRISFTCSNATEEELRAASLEAGRVHLDSLHQVEMWGKGKMGPTISLRLNQGIGAGHHAHVITGGPDSKFGIALTDLPEALSLAIRYGLTVTGIQQHVGSNVLDHTLLIKAAKKLLATAETLPDVTHVDFGGGLGIAYRPRERALDVRTLGKELSALVKEFNTKTGREVSAALEPGRYIVAEAGTLLVTVTDKKSTSSHTFIGVNSGFNHLVRPAMYDSYHTIDNVSRTAGKPIEATIAGNICESGDLFARARSMAAPQIGDILAIRTAGAYGFSMASNYNLRRLPREVFVTESGAKDVSFSPNEHAR